MVKNLIEGCFSESYLKLKYLMFQIINDNYSIFLFFAIDFTKKSN